MAVFPKVSPNRYTEDKGITHVAQVVQNEFGWLFKKVALQDDFGIDGYIEYVSEDGAVFGKQIAVQVKSGVSYFSRTEGNFLKYIGDEKHINYYHNLNEEVLIIIYNPLDNNCVWSHFDPHLIEKTKSGWSLFIPLNQKFNQNAFTDIKLLFGDVEDITLGLSENTEIYNSIGDHDKVIYFIGRDEIEALYFDWVLAFFRRISTNPRLSKKCQGNVELAIDGYDEDQRELFEIPEVIRWVKKALPLIKYHFYFLDRKSQFSTIKLLSCAYCEATYISGDRTLGKGILSLELNKDKQIEFLKIGFDGLNEISERLDLLEEDVSLIVNEICELFEIPIKI